MFVGEQQSMSQITQSTYPCDSTTSSIQSPDFPTSSSSQSRKGFTPPCLRVASSAWTVAPDCMTEAKVQTGTSASAGQRVGPGLEWHDVRAFEAVRCPFRNARSAVLHDEITRSAICTISGGTTSWTRSLICIAHLKKSTYFGI